MTVKEKQDLLNACDIIGKRLLSTDNFQSRYTKVDKKVFKDGREVEDYGIATIPTNGMGFGLNLGFIVRAFNYCYRVGDKYIVRDVYVTDSFDNYRYYKEIETDRYFLDSVEFNSHLFKPKYIIAELEDIRNGKGIRVGVLNSKHIVMLPSVLDMLGC